MANEIRGRTSVECVNDNDVSNEGTAAGDYTHRALDAHAASRSWGGSYKVSPAAGTAYDIQQLTAYMNVGSSAYLSGAALHIKGPWSATTVVVPQAFINTSTVTGDSLYKIAELNNLAGYTMAQATALTLNSGSGTKFTTGNGILYINITYKIINTTATMV